MQSAATQARTAARPVARGWRARLSDPVVLGLALVAVASLARVALTRAGATAAAVPPIRFIVSTPDSARALASFPWPAAMSPTGDAIVYQSRADQPNQIGLWLLRTDQVTGHFIPGTVGAHQVVFSPDGQWIAFEQGTKQWKLRLNGGTPVALAEGTGSNGADWSPSDELVYGATGPFHGLSVVSAAGGELAALTHPDSANGIVDHLWPIVHPDGQTIALTLYSGTASTAQLGVTTFGAGTVTPLGLKGLRSLAWLDGYLVYLQADGTVMAVAVSGTKVTGKPIPVHDRVRVLAANNGNSDVYISHGGALIVAAGELTSRLAWMGRDGVARPITHQAAAFAGPRLSPDGLHVAVLVTTDGKSDVWTFDFATSTLSRLTTSGAVTWADWSADGKYIVFGAAGTDSHSSFWRELAGGGAPPERLFDAADLTPSATVSPDGRSLVVMALHSNTWDLLRVPIDQAGTAAAAAAPTPYANSTANEMAPDFSPDGKWVAYQSDESGQFEVYIRSYPDPSTKVQISAGGGANAQWSADGSTIYYATLDGAVMEARVTAAPLFHVVTRAKAYPTGFANSSGFGGDFAMSRDGRQMFGLLGDSHDFRLTASPNWITEFRERVKPTVAK